MGKILKIEQLFSWLNFISTYRAQVCARKILWFRMLMKLAVTYVEDFAKVLRATKMVHVSGEFLFYNSLLYV